MKKILIIIIILIGCFSYYGVVNDDGEKVTNIQEIMHEQEKNETKNKITNVENKKETTKKDNSVNEKQSENKKVNENKEVEKDIEKKEEKVENIVNNNSIEEKQNTETVENKTGNNETNHIDNCLKGVHGMDVGNSKKWFDTKNDAIAQYEAEIKY